MNTSTHRTFFSVTMAILDFFQRITAHSSTHHQIHLTKLLPRAVVNAVYATDTISGNLPITTSQQGISMEQGRLAAEKPGEAIRCQADPSAKIATAASPHFSQGFVARSHEAVGYKARAGILDSTLSTFFKRNAEACVIVAPQ